MVFFTMMNLELQSKAAYLRTFHPGDTFIGPVNLGNSNEFTIKELADLVVKKVGSGSKVVYKDLPKDDPKVRCPNSSLAEQKLSWFPKTQLEKGLDSTIEYFRNEISL